MVAICCCSRIAIIATGNNAAVNHSTAQHHACEVATMAGHLSVAQFNAVMVMPMLPRGSDERKQFAAKFNAVLRGAGCCTANAGCWVVNPLHALHAGRADHHPTPEDWSFLVMNWIRPWVGGDPLPSDAMCVPFAARLDPSADPVTPSGQGPAQGPALKATVSDGADVPGEGPAVGGDHPAVGATALSETAVGGTATGGEKVVGGTCVGGTAVGSTAVGDACVESDGADVPGECNLAVGGDDGVPGEGTAVVAGQTAEAGTDATVPTSKDSVTTIHALSQSGTVENCEPGVGLGDNTLLVESWKQCCGLDVLWSREQLSTKHR